MTRPIRTQGGSCDRAEWTCRVRSRPDVNLMVHEVWIGFGVFTASNRSGDAKDACGVARTQNCQATRSGADAGQRPAKQCCLTLRCCIWPINSFGAGHSRARDWSQDVTGLCCERAWCQSKRKAEVGRKGDAVTQ